MKNKILSLFILTIFLTNFIASPVLAGIADDNAPEPPQPPKNWWCKLISLWPFSTHNGSVESCISFILIGQEARP